MRIAILGAPATGKTRLAQELVQHQPDLDVIADPPLGKVWAKRYTVDSTRLHELAQAHRQDFDLTLLTGLGLSCTAQAVDTPTQLEADAWLRSTLQQTGIAYGVIYGNGPQRLRHALRLIHPQKIATRTGWTWACEKCSDPDCEFRLFTGLRDSKAAVHPSS